MTLSIWWLIGLSQVTLVAVVLCIFFLVSLKIAKKKNKNLRTLVEKTISDYNTLSQNITAPESSDNARASISEPEPATGQSIEDNSELRELQQRVSELQQSVSESDQDWSQSITPQELEPAQLQSAIEHLITQYLTSEDDAATKILWNQFALGLQDYVHELKSATQDADKTLDQIKSAWSDKKTYAAQVFDNIVKISNKTDHANDLHESTNELYGVFVSVLNLIPDIDASAEDAFLKMEPVSGSETDQNPAEESSDEVEHSIEASDEDTDSAEDFDKGTDLEDADLEDADLEDTDLEDADLEDIVASLSAESSDEEISTNDTNATDTETGALEGDEVHSDHEISPETIMPLSQYALEHDEDELDLPPSAIQDFDEEASMALQPNIPPPTDPQKLIDESLGVDNDMFDELLTTMDETLNEHEAKNKAQKQG